MRYILLLIGVIVFQSFLISCKQNEKAAFRFIKLKYDTSAITIFEWDTTKYEFPKNSEPFSLSQKDIGTVDSLLNSQIQEFNKKQTSLLPLIYKEVPKEFRKPENFIINLKEYKRQYFFFEDVNGQKIAFVNCFCSDQPYWREHEVATKDGGKCYFRLKLNLTENRCLDFYVNGDV